MKEGNVATLLAAGACNENERERERERDKAAGAVSSERGDGACLHLKAKGLSGNIHHLNDSAAFCSLCTVSLSLSLVSCLLCLVSLCLPHKSNTKFRACFCLLVIWSCVVCRLPSAEFPLSVRCPTIAPAPSFARWRPPSLACWSDPGLVLSKTRDARP